jgi:NADPH:quinone reductase-like Zn-dependent oxidoreductase
MHGSGSRIDNGLIKSKKLYRRNKMRAIVQNAYGSPDVLKLKEVAKPAVDESDVLVRVHAASLNVGDVFSMRGSPFTIRFMVGFPKPKDYILGWDVAGTVETVGKNVMQFDQVTRYLVRVRALALSMRVLEKTSSHGNPQT